MRNPKFVSVETTHGTCKGYLYGQDENSLFLIHAGGNSGQHVLKSCVKKVVYHKSRKVPLKIKFVKYVDNFLGKHKLFNMNSPVIFNRYINIQWLYNTPWSSMRIIKTKYPTFCFGHYVRVGPFCIQVIWIPPWKRIK